MTLDRLVHRRAVWCLIAATAGWGLSFPIQKMLTAIQQELVPAAGSWFLTSWIICLRALLAAAVLLAWKPRLLRGVTRRELEQGALLGAIGGLALMLQADGLAHTNASTSAFLTQAYCVLLPIWYCAVQRRAPSGRLVLCTVMVVWGIAILSGFDGSTLAMGRGESETLGCAGASTIQILLLERPRYAVNRAMPVTVVMFLGFAACSAPIAALAAPQLGDLARVVASPTVAPYLAVLAILCTALPYGIMNHWQPRVGATEAALIYCCEPVWASTYALFLPGLLSSWSGVAYANETVTRALLVGGLLVTSANVFLQLRKPEQPIAPV